MPKVNDPNLIVGLDSVDDAAVYRLNADTAIVQSVDFFTPIVDDPFTFGRIAAANALSDIYAMGARPLFALNLLAFPSKKLPESVLEGILKGGAEMAAEADISIVGGHSIDDPEPKYGMAVTGIVNPDRIVKNSTARPGDHLILTKPLGIGIIATAIKKGIAAETVVEEAVNWMTTLNRAAAEVMVETGVSAATDITGFGLLGHLKELVDSSGVGAKISASMVPVIDGTKEYLEKGAYPEGSLATMEFVEPSLQWDGRISESNRKILCDAQTSGGLLICVPEEKAETLTRSLERKNVYHVNIGGIVSEHPGRITVNA